jgi:hypothetical protein
MKIAILLFFVLLLPSTSSSKRLHLGIISLIKEKVKELKEKRAPVLYATPLELDFGKEEVQLSISLENKGYMTLKWRVQYLPYWCKASKKEGVLKRGEKEKIFILAMREGLDEGEREDKIKISSNGGEASIKVKISVEEEFKVLWLLCCGRMHTSSSYTLLDAFGLPVAGIVQDGFLHRVCIFSKKDKRRLR